MYPWSHFTIYSLHPEAIFSSSSSLPIIRVSVKRGQRLLHHGHGHGRQRDIYRTRKEGTVKKHEGEKKGSEWNDRMMVLP